MHFLPHTSAVALALSVTLGGAIPVPQYSERALPPIHISSVSVYARAPQVATIRQFARDDGSNACIDGVLDWVLATATGPDASSNTTSASGANPTELLFVDACIDEVIVSKLADVFNNTVTTAPPAASAPLTSSSGIPTPSSDPSTSDPSASAPSSASDAAPSASSSATPGGNATTDGSDGANSTMSASPGANSTTDGTSDGNSTTSAASSANATDTDPSDDSSSRRRHVETPRAIHVDGSLDRLLAKIASKFSHKQ
ncbi:hypothetical protein DFH07DRAFT_774702 [Mycena maculata]|uniref:Uncharacterized protein n=1 Tax=Mycena maculata TaxID=230809 RepID=A0AAD7IZD0_9AGAR|nr:hypothetical protein DFH07DRAFT_774702 [Mycena maculata]